jgi:predicted transcriptional regulator
MMTLPAKIIELLTQSPNLTAKDIAQKIEVAQAKVKVTLWKLNKTGKVKREKVKTEDKRKGPQSEYRYQI